MQPNTSLIQPLDREMDEDNQKQAKDAIASEENNEILQNGLDDELKVAGKWMILWR